MISVKGVPIVIGVNIKYPVKYKLFRCYNFCCFPLIHSYSFHFMTTIILNTFERNLCIYYNKICIIHLLTKEILFILAFCQCLCLYGKIYCKQGSFVIDDSPAVIVCENARYQNKLS